MTKPQLVVVFDCGEARIYARKQNGGVDYSNDLPWPAGWPQYVTASWLEDLNIPWTTG